MPGHKDLHAAGFVDRALKAGFVPHKALYDIKLAGTRSGSQVLNISGQMFYEWHAKCEAWTSDHRFNLFYEYADSPPMRISSHFSTYESHDGKSMDFASKRRRDGQVFQELRGHASREDGKAVYTMPEGLDFDLSPDTVFPMEHSLQVLEHAKKGDRFYKAVIFDGSDEEGPVEVNTFIGDVIKKGVESISADAMDSALLQSPARMARLAFFPVDDPASVPDYEMTMIFHDNGVISDMLIEYHDFSVSQKLVALEAIEDDCNAAATGQ